MTYARSPQLPSETSLSRLRALPRLGLVTALLPALALGACGGESSDTTGPENITDVNHTPVERQSIGNCWLYAESTWLESMHLTATGEEFDNSQSYLTYWDWYGKLVGGRVYGNPDEFPTGGSIYLADRIIRDRGLMAEADFIDEDGISEMSWRQKEALLAINFEITEGRLKTPESRYDRKLVRDILDEIWQLSDQTIEMLDGVFGEDGSQTIYAGTADVDSTPIIDAASFEVKYTRFNQQTQRVESVDGYLDRAISDWREVSYPSYGSKGSSLKTSRRNFLKRVQRALHDSQPVMITWDVDFNAMSGFDSEIPGAFTKGNIELAGGPGRQGGHITVLEDYQATTVDFGLLEAGVTLDPALPEDSEKLTAALRSDTKIEFLRIKNSWGGFRDDRTSVPDFPGYHDLYMDYLNGPISWCPSVEDEGKTSENCKGKTTPLDAVRLPPGY